MGQFGENVGLIDAILLFSFWFIHTLNNDLLFLKKEKKKTDIKECIISLDMKIGPKVIV